MYVGTAPVRAGAVDVLVGACVVDTFELSGSVTLIPGNQTWNVDGSGTCQVVPGGSVDVTFAGDLGRIGTHPTSSCAAGVLDGTIDVDLHFPTPVSWTTAATAVLAGPVLALVTVQGTTLVGAGVFVDLSVAVLGCTPGPVTTTAFVGAYALVDPEVP